MSKSRVNAKIGKNCLIFASHQAFIMKIWFKQILLLVIGLFVAIIMPAQNLPVLQADPAIRTGVLPNGTTYYIVSNSTIKGVADFALVQKTGTANIQDTASFKAIRTAQDALNSLPRCLAPTAQSYMTAHGAVPGPGGFGLLPPASAF